MNRAKAGTWLDKMKAGHEIRPFTTTGTCQSVETDYTNPNRPYSAQMNEFGSLMAAKPNFDLEKSYSSSRWVMNLESEPDRFESLPMNHLKVLSNIKSPMGLPMLTRGQERLPRIKNVKRIKK